MNIKYDEKNFYKDALEESLLSGGSCYRKLEGEMHRIEHEEQGAKTIRMSAFRVALVCGVILLAGCAVAAGILLKGKGSNIPFFSETDQASVQAQKDDYERHSDSVQDPFFGADGNRILTVENIAIHKDRITVFYSQSDGGSDLQLVLSVNGGEERTPAQTELAGTGEHESVMSSFWIFPEVPEKCSLTLRFRKPDNSLLAEKTYQVDLSEREEDDVTILSGLKIEIKGTNTEEPVEAPYRPFHNHIVAIDSVRMGRDGGCMTISEEILPQGPYQDKDYAAWAEKSVQAKEAYFAEHPGSTDLEWEQNGIGAFLEENPCPLTPEQISSLWEIYDEMNPVSWDPFVNFSVTDEAGHSLMPWIPYITGGSGTGKAVNEILFTPREGMREIRVTPLYYAGELETVKILFDKNGSDTDPASDKLELVSYSVDEQQRSVTVSYRITGIRILDSYSEFLLDTKGERVQTHTSTEEVKYEDAASGIVTTQIWILDPEYDMRQIAGYGQEWSVPYPDEKRAVTISLDP